MKEMLMIETALVVGLTWYCIRLRRRVKYLTETAIEEIKFINHAKNVIKGEKAE